MNLFFDLTDQLGFVETLFVSRSPIPLVSFNNVTKPFAWTVWIAIAVSLLACSAYFLASHKIYSRLQSLTGIKLVQEEVSSLNFFLFTFFKITEPDPLSWFKEWTGGKAVVFMWSFLALFLSMAYTSNLRAHMMTVRREHPLDTLQDIVDYAHRPWIFNGLLAFK